MAIDVAKQIEYWRRGATEEVDAARALLNARKIRQAAFFVHLAIEKALKAEVVAITKVVAPFTHNLLSLAEKAQISLTDGQRDLLGRVREYCLEGRYPEELPLEPKESVVATDLIKVQEMIQWLKNRSINP